MKRKLFVLCVSLSVIIASLFLVNAFAAPTEPAWATSVVCTSYGSTGAVEYDGGNHHISVTTPTPQNKPEEYYSETYKVLYGTSAGECYMETPPSYFMGSHTTYYSVTKVTNNNGDYTYETVTGSGSVNIKPATVTVTWDDDYVFFKEADEGTTAYFNDYTDAEPEVEVSGIVTGSNEDKVEDVHVKIEASYDSATVGQSKKVSATYTLEGPRKDCYSFETGSTTTTKTVSELPGIIVEPDKGYFSFSYPDVSYDGQPHGVSVSRKTNNVPSSYTVKYATSKPADVNDFSLYTETDSPTQTSIGDQKVYVIVKFQMNGKTCYETSDGTITVDPIKLTVSGTTVNPDARAYSAGDTSFPTGNITVGTVSGISGTWPNVSVSVSGASFEDDIASRSSKNLKVTYTVTGSDAGYYSAPTGDTLAAYITGETLAEGSGKDYTFTKTLTGSNHEYSYTTTYDGSAQTVSVTPGTDVTVMYKPDEKATSDYTATSAPTYTDVGTYTIYYKMTKAGYYEETGTITLTIQKAEITVKKGAIFNDKEYDGTTTATVKEAATFEGKCGTDDVTVEVDTANFKYAHADNNGQIDIDVKYKLSGAKAGNYKLKSDTGTAKAKITECDDVDALEAEFTDVELTDYDSTYDGSAHGISVSGTKDGDSITYCETEDGTYSGTAPTYKVTGGAGKSVYVKIKRANYVAYVVGSADICIEQKEVTVTEGTTTIADLDYTTAQTNKAASVTVGTVNGILPADSGVTVTGSGTFPAGTVGEHSIEVTYALSGDTDSYYTLSTTSETVTGKIKGGTFTEADFNLAGYSAAYDGSAHGITASFKTTVINGSITYSTDTTGTAANKTYAATAPTKTDPTDSAVTVYIKATADGYDPFYTSRTISISKLKLTVTADSTKLADKTYDGSASADFSASGDAVGTLSNLVAADNGKVTLSASGTYASANVGNGISVPVTYSITGDRAKCYEAPANTTISANIVKETDATKIAAFYAGTTVTGFDGTYDGNNHAVTVSGNPAGSTATYSDDAGSTYSASATNFKIGDHDVKVKFTHKNYGDYVVDTSVKIAKATITVTGSPTATTIANLAYATAQSNPAATVTVGTFTGKVGTDDISVAGSASFPNAPAVGDYTLDVTYSLTGAATDYYQLASTTAQVTGHIQGQTLTGVSANNYEAAYDGSAHGIGFTGVVTTGTPDKITYCSTEKGTYQATAIEYTKPSETATAQTVYAKIERAGYEPLILNATVKINKKQLTVSGTTIDGTKEYDGTNTAKVTANGTLGDVVNSEAVEIDKVTATYASTDVKDNIAVTVKYTIKGDDAGNYLAPVDGSKTANITKQSNADKKKAFYTDATNSGSFTDYVKAYDATEHTITVNGYSSEKDFTVKYSTDNGTSYTATEAPKFLFGDNTVYIQISHKNYEDYTTTAKVTISKATIKVTGTTTIDEVQYADAQKDPGVAAKVTIESFTGKQGTDDVYVKGTASFPAKPKVGYYTLDVTYELAGNTAKYYELDATTKTAKVQGRVKGKDFRTDFPATEFYAVNYDEQYDNKAHGISFVGKKDGDEITYSTEATGEIAKKTYTANQPTCTYPTDTASGVKTVYARIDRPGYEPFFTSATINIQKKQLVISAAKPSTVTPKPYDNNNKATVVLGDVQGIYDTNATVEVDTATYASVNVAKNIDVSVKYKMTGTHPEYYLAPVDETLKGEIEKAVIPAADITVTDVDRQYDGNAYAITVKAKDDDVVKYSNDDGKTYTLTEAPKYDIGTHTVYVQVYRDTNHQYYYVTGTVKISQIQLTVSGTKVIDKEFDGLKSGTVVVGPVSGILEKDKANVTVVGKATFTENKISDVAPVTVTYSLEGSAAKYYIAPKAETDKTGKLTVADCVSETTGALKEGEYRLVLDGNKVGTYQFLKYANGYALYDTAQKKYVGFDESAKAIKMVATPYEWRYTEDALYTTVATISTTKILWWTKHSTNVVNYYLNTENGRLSTGLLPEKAEIGYEVHLMAHNYVYTDNGETHTRVCTNCHATVTGLEHTFDKTGKCVCGAVNGDYCHVQGVNVNKEIVEVRSGFLFWVKVAEVTRYTITVDSPNVKVTSVEYSFDRVDWNNSLSFDSEIEDQVFYIRVTDQNKEQTIWKYDGTAKTKLLSTK